MPMITAIVPVFNAEVGILRTIKSLQEQTFSDWEAVVIDDGSTDRTAEVVQCESERDPRLQLWRLEVNCGRGAARNAALRKARGKFIAFCDAGDESAPYRFAESLRLFDSYPAAVAVTGQIARRVRDREVPDPHFQVSGEMAADALRRGIMSVANPTAMVRSNVIPDGDGFHPSLRRCEDLYFFSRLASLHPEHSFIISSYIFTYYDRPTHTPWRYWLENAMYLQLARQLLELEAGEAESFANSTDPCGSSLRLPPRKLLYEFARWVIVDQRNRLRTLKSLLSAKTHSSSGVL